jgi:hypothetical protein
MKNITFETRRVIIIPLNALIDGEDGENDPGFDESKKIESHLIISELLKALPSEHKKVVKLLIAGYNFNRIGYKLKYKPSKIYRTKNELKAYLTELLP